MILIDFSLIWCIIPYEVNFYRKVIMAGKAWTGQEIDLLKKLGPNTNCRDIAKQLGRSVRSVQHKFGQLGLKKERAKIGDVINGWKIVDTYELQEYGQIRTHAVLESTIDDQTRDCLLTKLTNDSIGWPDRRRPDLSDKNRTHGLSNHPLYNVWNGIINRCTNTKHISYENYGGRGIKVCQSWCDDFKKFYDWAIESGWCQGLHVDRIDNNKDYSPANCRLVTPKQNNRNKSTTIQITYQGDTKCVNAWIEDDRCKCKSAWSIIYRLNKGWKVKDIFAKPARKRQKNTLYLRLYEYVEMNHPDILKEFKDQDNER